MIYSISDLHLSIDKDKPMDIFGDNWQNHMYKIEEDWLSKVKVDDVVLVPGDLSWGLKLEDALPDLEFIDKLPGTKIIVKGNHDYWWSSYTKVKSLPFKTLKFIQNNSLLIDDISFCGSRGWMLPMDGYLDEDDVKIYNRELIRLEMSLKDAKSSNIIALLHYPPFSRDGKGSEVTDLLERYGVKKCVYGHVHKSFKNRKFIDGEYNNIEYKLVSCDYLDFKLYQII